MNCLRKSSATSKLLPGNSNAGWLGLLVLILLLGLFGAEPVLAKEFRFYFDDTLEVGRDPVIRLECYDGNVEIIGDAFDQIFIETTTRIQATSVQEAEQIASGIQVTMERSGDRIEITSTHDVRDQKKPSFFRKLFGLDDPPDAYAEVDWVIHVPERSKIELAGRAGRWSMSHLIGDIKIEGSAARIELLSIEGAVDIQNTSGAVSGEFLYGPVTVRQAMGEIALDWVEGDTRIKSSSASVKLRQERGALDIETVSGDVEIQTSLDSFRDYFVKTESGHITLAVPETSSGDIRIVSEVGEIQIDVPVAIRTMTKQEVQGRFGSGGVQLHLVSVSGNVTIAQF